MGDRGNIAIMHPNEKTPVFFYTHWNGFRITEVLAKGLKKAKDESRLDDYAYATRIIFDTLTGLEGGSTGYGISIGSPCDNEYPIPFVSWKGSGEPVVIYGEREISAEEFITEYLVKVES